SGLYRVGSDMPLWTISWHDGFCFLSPDANHLVRVRDFGDFDHPNDEESGWALKFYAKGRLIRQWSVEEIIDFPSLIPAWYHSILPDVYSDDEPRMEDGIFTLPTFTHERYRFETSTGKIVEEFRLWRT